MVLLKPYETSLIGRWIATDGGVIADQISSPIDFLVMAMYARSYGVW